MDEAILFPQTLFGCEWVQLPAEARRLAVKLRGPWTNRESFLRGITPEGCSFPGETIAELGFSFRRTAWMAPIFPGRVTWKWCGASSLQRDASQAWRLMVACLLNTEKMLAGAVERTEESELAIFYKPAVPVRGVEENEWVRLGVAPWKTATLSQWRQWNFTIMFKAATSLGRGRVTKARNPHEAKREHPADYRGPFLGHECGIKSQGPRGGSERPRVEVLLEQDLTRDVFGDAPSVRKDADKFRYQWDGLQLLAQRLRAATRKSRPRTATRLRPRLYPEDPELLPVFLADWS